MRLRSLIFNIIAILGCFTLSAQEGAWWEPAAPFSGETITIYFDPTQSDEMPDDITSLVLHWGINGWQTPPSEIWPPGTVIHSDNIAARSPVEEIGENLWAIDVPTTNETLTLDFVFNDGTPSNPGSNWAHTTGGADWEIEFFQSAITAVLISPEIDDSFGNPLRSPAFVGTDESMTITATAVTFDVGLASLTLNYGNETLASTADDTLVYELDGSQFPPGANELTVIAESDAGDTHELAFHIFVNTTPMLQAPPQGTEPGITYVDVATVRLALFAPYKEFVYVIGDFNDWLVDETYYMRKHEVSEDSVLWWLTIEGLSPAVEYAFQYYVDGEIRVADPYTDKVLDSWNDPWIPDITYPNLKPYPEGMTAEPTAVFETAQSEFNWVYSDTFQRPEQHNLVIYEMLLRDFIARHDYETMMDTLDYLDNLGINAIELMPFSEFEGNSSWGYNPSFYFAPDKYYGTKNDLKTFIDECHRRGIAVIQDIVLNHAYGQNTMARLYWDSANNRPAENNPWFNTVSPNPVFAWGNDFDHDSEHTQYFIDRVIEYWLTEYRVDGFRFDFTKGHTNTPGDGWAHDDARINLLQRMADQMWEVEEDSYVILEHFAENSEEQILSGSGMMLWGNMNYNYNEATMGWNENNKSDFSWGYYGNRGWWEPNLVTYMESHDEERLMFKNLAYGNSMEDYDIQELNTALERIKLASAFFYTYPGPKMLWMFGEVGYDVSIDDPCRVCEKPILWEYFEDEYRKKLYKTTAALLKLRNGNELFRNPNTDVDMWLNDAGGRKRILLEWGEHNASIIGNFGVNDRNINPEFAHTGWWYNYFDGDSIDVTDLSADFILKPGEFRIYTNSYIEPPEYGILDDIDLSDLPLPKKFALHQNYPNPFNPSTVISLQLAVASKLNLTIYDVNGRVVNRLVDGQQFGANHYEVTWDGTNDAGNPVASGVYFYEMTTDQGFAASKKMIFLK